MTISLVSEQEFHSTAAAATNPFTATGITAAVGDWLVAVVHLKVDKNGALTVSATDPAGNTWTQLVTSANGNNGTNSRVAILATRVASSLSADTVTFTTSAAYAYTVNLTRWTGVSIAIRTAAVADVTSPSFSASAAECLSISGLSYPSATAPTSITSGWTVLTGISPDISYYGANAYKIDSSSTPQTVTWGAPNVVGHAVAVLQGPGTSTIETTFVQSRTTAFPSVRLASAARQFVDVLVSSLPPRTSTTTITVPALVLASTARPSVSGATGLTLPALLSASTARANVSTTASVTIPLIVAAATASPRVASVASIALPLPVAGGLASVPLRGAASLSIPAVLALSQVEIEARSVTGLEIPALIVAGHGTYSTQGTASITLPLLEVLGAATAPGHGVASCTLPLVAVAGQGFLEVRAGGTTQLPTLAVSAAATSYITAVATITLPGVFAAGHGTIPLSDLDYIAAVVPRDWVGAIIGPLWLAAVQAPIWTVTFGEAE